MKKHNFNVYNGNNISYAGGFLTTGSNADTAEFKFDSSYDDAPVRKVYFKTDESIVVVLLQGNTCTIPVYLEPGMLYVGIQGLSDDGEEVHTTTYAPVEVLQGAYGDGVEPPVINPDEAAQLMAMKADDLVYGNNILQLKANGFVIGTPVTVTGEKGDRGETGLTGAKGDTGQSFKISKFYSSVAELQADTSPIGIVSGEFAIILSNSEDPDNSRLYLWDGNVYTYVNDLSGGVGIKGDKGDKGDVGDIGPKGDTGLSGYTPVKGTDYYTTAEILEVRTGIYNDLLANVLGPVDSINGEVI